MKYDPTHTYELQPAGPAQQFQEKPVTTDKYEKLIELQKLLDQNIITREEFEREKKKILEDN